jgi:hypothetical protein
MTRIYGWCFLLLFFIACNNSNNKDSCQTDIQAESANSPECTLTDNPVVGENGSDSTTNLTITDDTNQQPVDGPLSPLAYSFDTDVSFFNTTVTQEEKFNAALEIIKRVIATEEFKERVLNHSYNGMKTFVDNRGFSNSQIYQKILEGAETLQPTKDNELDMEVELYYAATNTVGYTYPNTKRIWVNLKYFNSYTFAGVAHNLMHEWLHKLGFTHASTWSVSRDFSVPYAIGDIVGEIGKDFL